MLALYADESHDARTYALGGWLVTPIHYDISEAEWKKMLASVAMPDGSPCPAFHAALMMNQRGPFVGWEKEHAFDAFSKATNVLADRPGRYAICPCAVAAEIPENLTGADKDAIWLLLFMKFFVLVLQTFPAAAGISFVFDKKAEIEKSAHDGYAKVTGAIASEYPGVFLEGMTFVDDNVCAGVQAADLLIYEWRKRITDQRPRPDHLASRVWFPRIRAARQKGALVRYDVEKHIRERHAVLESAEQVRRMLFGNEVGRD